MRVGPAALDEAALLSAVRAPGRGGIALFLGTIRDRHEGREVVAVTYEAFLPLAERELADILGEASRRWGVRAEAAHRVGRLAVGEAALGVAAASPHRGEAFAACRWTVDEIKRRLPVWKKEHYADGESAWLPGCALGAAEAAR